MGGLEPNPDRNGKAAKHNNDLRTVLIESGTKVFVAIIVAGAGVAGYLVQGSYDVTTEEQKNRGNLVVELMSTDITQAGKNLEFAVAAGFIPDTEGNIKRAIKKFPPSLPASPDAQKLMAWYHELLGYMALIERDYDQAKLSFDAAYKFWPVFHSVDEIRNLLSENEQLLKNGNTNKWDEIIKTIHDKYSWHVDVWLKQKLR